MRVELWYFEGCPSWEHAWAELGRALVAEGLPADVALVDVETLPEADRAGFAGSPSIRIDGRDLEGYAGPGVMACRRYPENGGKGWPSAERIRARLREAGRERPGAEDPGSGDPGSGDAGAGDAGAGERGVGDPGGGDPGVGGPGVGDRSA